jgi:hypothetical protein
MEEIVNFIEYAVEDSTLHHDLEGNPSIDPKKLNDIMVEYITKREAKLRKQVVAEAKQAIQTILAK